MLIKKNWSQFKELQAPSTQSAPPDQSGRSLLASNELPDGSSELPDANYDDGIEVLPRLNDEESSGDELDKEELSDDDQMRENFLAEKLKEKGIDIPLPFKKKSNTMAPDFNQGNNSGKDAKPV